METRISQRTSCLIARQAAYISLIVFPWAMNACTGSNPSERPQRLRVAVGQIKEVGLENPKDYTWQLTGSSENKEIVEVSNQELAPADAQPTQVKPGKRAVFLIKGVSTGTAKVVFSERGSDEQLPSRIRKTYLVEVVNQ